MPRFKSATFAFLFVGAPAFAQSYDFTPPINGIDIYFSNQNFNDAIDRVVDNSAPDDGPSSQSTSQVSADVLNFPASQQRRKANITKFADSMKRNDPSNSSNIDALFGGGEIIGRLDEMMRPWGLRTNNVADAYTVWWVAAWHAVNRRELTPDPITMGAVKRQAQGALLSTPQLTAASNASKQEMAEALLVQAMLIDGGIDDAAGNSVKQAALAKAVNQGAKRMGLDLTKMTLTQDGFVPRSGGRSDAGDAEGDDSQLAANDDGAHAEGASMGDYALYAVAGTGLLAGMFALGKGFSKKG